jgi:DNA-binding CsgD family transcriptional regulator
LGMFLNSQSMVAEAHTQFEKAVAQFRKLADKHALSKSLDWLAYSTASAGDLDQAKVLWHEVLTLAREVSDLIRLSSALFQLGFIAIVQDNWTLADKILEESLALAQEMGQEEAITTVLRYQASLARLRGNQAHAADLAKESLVLARKSGHTWDILEALLILGGSEQALGDLALARALFEEGLSLSQKAGNDSITGKYLAALGNLAVAEQQPHRAARLFGAAEGLLDMRNPMDFDPSMRLDYERDAASVRAQLGEVAYNAAQAEGRAMFLDHLLNSHESTTEPVASKPTSSTKSSLPAPSGLTARELDVLRLLAEGLSNAQIAARLVISPRTVDNHLVSLYSKLHVSSRTAAARYAHEQHLL